MKKLLKAMKRRYISVMIISAVILSMLPICELTASAYETVNFEGNNLFTDGSFESQKKGAFGFNIATDNAHTGSKSLTYDATGTEKIYKYLRSVSQLDATKNYQIGVWAKTSAVSQAGEIFFWSDNETVGTQFGKTTITNEWVYYSYRINGFSSGKVNLNLGLGITDGFNGVTVLFDDFSIVEIKAPTNSDLVSDGSFEDGAYGNTDFTLDSNVSNAHTGEKSLKAVADGKTKQSSYYSANVTQDLAYIVGVWIRADKKIDEKIVGFNGYYYDTSNEKHDLEPFGEFSVTKEWTYCQFKLKNIKKVKTLYVGFTVKDKANEVTVWFDDLSISQTDEIADNLFEDDPSFEGSGYTDKNFVQVDDEAHTGSKSLKVEANGTWKEYSYFKTASNLDSNKTYLLSVYAKSDIATDTDTIFFKGAFTGDIPWTDLGNCNYKKTTEEWTKYTYILELKNYEFAADKVNFMFCLGVAGYVSGATVWFDDVSLIEIADIEHLDTGLYPDGDFESNCDAYKSGTWQQDMEVSYGGVSSLKCIGNAESDSFFSRDVLIDDPTATYKLTLYIKTENCPGKSDVNVNVCPQDPTNSWKYGWYTGKSGTHKLISTGGTHGWTKYTYTFRGVFAEDVDKCHIYLRNDSTGTVWFDNVSFKKIENVEPKGPMTAFPNAGAVDNFTKVALGFGDADVSIMYTLDGTDPKTSDSVKIYNEDNGIIITGDTTITAYAQAEGYSPSENYTFNYFAPPMLENGNFEDGMWEGINDKEWKLITDDGQNNVITSLSELHSEISSPVVSINPEYAYKIKFKAKTENIPENGAGCYVTLHNSSKGTAGNQVYDGNKELLMLPAGTNGWQEYSVVVSNISEEFDGLIINAFSNGEGKVYFDDFSVDVEQVSLDIFEVSGSTDKLGNIYFGDPDKEEIAFYFQIDNTMNRTFENTEVLVQTEDMLSGNIVAEEKFTFDLIESKETINRKLNLSALSYYGAFKIHVFVKNESVDFESVFRVGRVKETAKVNDKVCINCHILAHFDGGEREKTMLETLDFLKAAGIGIICDDFLWSDIEKTKGEMIIPDNYYRFIDACRERGIKIRMGMKYTNPVYGNFIYPTQTADIDACALALSYFAKEFEDVITSAEVIGEADFWLGDAFGSTYPDPTYNPESYAKLCIEIYKKVKSVCPQIKVNYGGVLRFGGRSTLFTERMFKAGILDYTDSLSIHSYCNPGTPYGVIDSWFTQLEELAAKYSSKKFDISIGEMGWSSYDGDMGCSEAEQASFTMQSYLMNVAKGNIDVVSYYDMSDDGINSKEIEANFGFLGERFDSYGINGTPYLIKPAYCILPTVSDLLTGIKFEKELSLGSGIIAMKFKSPDGKDLVSLWDYHGDSKRLTLSTSGIKGDITVYDINGNESYISSQKNKFSFMLSAAPVFVTADVIESLSTSVIDDDDVETKEESSNPINGDTVETFEDDEYEIEEYYEEYDEEPQDDKEYYEVVKRIARRKKHKSLPIAAIAGIVGGSVVLAAGICLLIILLIKKKRKKASV